MNLLLGAGIWIGVSIVGVLAVFIALFFGLVPVTYVWSLIDGVTLASGNYRHEDGGELYEKVDWYGWLYVAAQVLTILGGFLYMGVVVAAIATAFSGAGASTPVTP